MNNKVHVKTGDTVVILSGKDLSLIHILVPGAAHAQSFAVDTKGCQKQIAGFLEKYGGA